MDEFLGGLVSQIWMWDFILNVLTENGILLKKKTLVC